MGRIKLIAAMFAAMTLTGCSTSRVPQSRSLPQPGAEYVSFVKAELLLPRNRICCETMYTRIGAKAYLDAAGTKPDLMKVPWAVVPVVQRLPQALIKSLWQVEVNGINQYKVVYFHEKDLADSIPETGWIEKQLAFEKDLISEIYRDRNQPQVGIVTVNAMSLAPHLVRGVSLTFDVNDKRAVNTGF